MVGASVVATVISLSFHHTNAANAHAMPKVVRPNNQIQNFLKNHKSLAFKNKKDKNL